MGARDAVITSTEEKKVMVCFPPRSGINIFRPCCFFSIMPGKTDIQETPELRRFVQVVVVLALRILVVIFSKKVLGVYY